MSSHVAPSTVMALCGRGEQAYVGSIDCQHC